MRSYIQSALTAVDDDAGAADPACARRSEKRDDGRDLVGAPEPAERQLPAHELGNPLRVGLLAFVPRAAGKQDRSRCDAVDADVGRRELLRERLPEADLRGLDGVVRHPAAGLAPVD